jgi:hypothetical protein
MKEMAQPLDTLERDLREIFGSRLLSVVAYGERTRAARQEGSRTQGAARQGGHSSSQPIRTLAIVESLGRDDLRACAQRIDGWHQKGLATPLVLASHEFDRSLDVFPMEFGAILADHTVVAGSNPFEQLTVDPDDLRRAVEVQARGHLLHLREGYIETRARGDALAVLILQSAPAFAALLLSLARLNGRATHDPSAAARHGETLVGADSVLTKIVDLVGVHDIPSSEAERLFPPYLDAVQRLVQYVDTWSRR